MTDCYKLIYIGKSNKKFTYNKEYLFFGGVHTNKTIENITIIDNRNSMHYYRDDKLSYFFKNFKLLNENEYKVFIRTKKLKKISNESKRKNT